jgi:hypothetical protein
MLGSSTAGRGVANFVGLYVAPVAADFLESRNAALSKPIASTHDAAFRQQQQEQLSQNFIDSGVLVNGQLPTHLPAALSSIVRVCAD